VALVCARKLPQVLSLFALLYWYNSTNTANTDAARRIAVSAATRGRQHA
jgi:hypothetical protein